MFKNIFRKSKPETKSIDPLWTESEPQPPDRTKPGWVSPEYSFSRRVDLDPAILEENRCIGFFPDAWETEFYRVIRSRILKLTSPSGGNTLMVTSTLAGEGKTLTAINLAFAIAKEFRETVLLVDCDLKNQSIHERLGFESDKGLIDYLVDDRPISEIMAWPGVEKVTLISGGRTVQESSELLGSKRMKELVKDMKARYPERYIIFDLPPVLSGADALAFAHQVDHIIMVVAAGKTPKPDIRRALGLLPKEKILGLILNGQEMKAVKKYKYKGA